VAVAAVADVVSPDRLRVTLPVTVSSGVLSRGGASMFFVKRVGSFGPRFDLLLEA